MKPTLLSRIKTFEKAPETIQETGTKIAKLLEAIAYFCLAIFLVLLTRAA